MLYIEDDTANNPQSQAKCARVIIQRVIDTQPLRSTLLHSTLCLAESDCPCFLQDCCLSLRLSLVT